MNRLSKLAFAVIVLAAFIGFFAFMSHGHTLAIFDPKGPIAAKERALIIEATLLMLIVVVPVFVLTFLISWKFRAGNDKAAYSPTWDHHAGLEFIWWALPCLIIVAISTLAWKSSHELDPYKPIDSTVAPITIQVVALPWKWLFIYPAQHIATVNMVEFPAGTPVNFVITSDAPMNSFWIPQLGGQIYAMPGMSTQLHLMADKPGTYRGSSANLSGAGFAGMKFAATSVSRPEFDSWVSSVQQSDEPLSLSAYDTLSAPSENTPVTYFSSAPAALYSEVVEKYMMPGMEVK